ncbi:hypothetical protein GF362_03390 [Candidatus Dojkabacteria bacterium]|nr:hypothetical protein [Candidatus Dojkabacteria bacterium]
MLNSETIQTTQNAVSIYIAGMPTSYDLNSSDSKSESYLYCSRHEQCDLEDTITADKVLKEYLSLENNAKGEYKIHNLVNRLNTVSLTEEQASKIDFVYSHTPKEVLNLFAREVALYSPGPEDEPSNWSNKFLEKGDYNPKKDFDIKWKHCAIDIPLITYNLLYDNRRQRNPEFNNFDPRIVFAITMLHDIARFKQLDLTDEWDDRGFEHAEEAERIIENDNNLKRIFNDHEIQIIKAATKYHNKIEVDNSDEMFRTDSEALMYSYLIRDIDKLANLFGKDGIANLRNRALNTGRYRDSNINTVALQSFLNMELVDKHKVDTLASLWIMYLAWIHEFHFDSSKTIFLERALPVLMHNLQTEKEKGNISAEQMHEIKDVVHSQAILS